MASIAANPAFVNPRRPRQFAPAHKYLQRPDAARQTPHGIGNGATWRPGLPQLAGRGHTGGTPSSQPEPPASRLCPTCRNVEAAVRDIATVHQLDRQYVRYFSYRSQYNGVMGCETEAAFTSRMRYYQAGFRKLLNSLSYGPTLVIPKPVANTRNTLVRVDLRDLRWSAADWDRMIGHYFYRISEHGSPSLETLVRGTGTVLPVVRTELVHEQCIKTAAVQLISSSCQANIHTLEKDVLRVDTAANIRNLDAVARRALAKAHQAYPITTGCSRGTIWAKADTTGCPMTLQAMSTGRT